jgi:hypothetical protein
MLLEVHNYYMVIVSVGGSNQSNNYGTNIDSFDITVLGIGGGGTPKAEFSTT